MVTIRLARHGGKKNPFYHVTVAEKSAKRDGRFIERLGFYNPVARGRDEKLRIDLERVDYWLSNGAQASERVKQLVARSRKGLDAVPADVNAVETAAVTDDTAAVNDDTAAATDESAAATNETASAADDADAAADETEASADAPSGETEAEATADTETGDAVVADAEDETPADDDTETA